MVMYLREIYRNRKSTILWTSILVSYNVCILLLFPSLQGNLKGTVDAMMASFPKEMMAAFGLDRVSMTEILGYYNAYCYLIVTILGGIFAVLQGSAILSKEEDERTIEFLLSKPVSRNKIVTSKVCAVLTNIAILNVVTSLFTYLTICLVTKESYNMTALLLLFIGPMFMQITFGAIGLITAVFVVKARINYPIGVGVVLGCYFISIIAVFLFFSS